MSVTTEPIIKILKILKIRNWMGILKKSRCLLKLLCYNYDYIYQVRVSGVYLDNILKIYL